MHEHRVIRQAYDIAGAHDEARGVLDRLARALVEDPEHLVEAAADRLPRRRLSRGQ